MLVRQRHYHISHVVPFPADSRDTAVRANSAISQQLRLHASLVDQFLAHILCIGCVLRGGTRAPPPFAGVGGVGCAAIRDMGTCGTYRCDGSDLGSQPRLARGIWNCEPRPARPSARVPGSLARGLEWPFFLLLIAFLLGSLSLGLLSVKGRGLERLTGILLLLSIPLSVMIILGEYWNVNVASRLENIVYPVLQPASRIVMGVWLWNSARRLKQMES